MNIFAIHNNFTPSACNKSLSPTFISNTPVVYELPDTALLLKHRPFFIPDYAQPCSYQGSLVIRISRLGRYIAPNMHTDISTQPQWALPSRPTICLNIACQTICLGTSARALTVPPPWDSFSLLPTSISPAPPSC